MTTIEVIREHPPALGRCSARTCGKRIEWVRTVKANRAMPLDHPVVVESVHERADGTLVTVVDAAASHFATCREARTFRRAR